MLYGHSVCLSVRHTETLIVSPVTIANYGIKLFKFALTAAVNTSDGIKNSRFSTNIGRQYLGNDTIQFRAYC